MPCFLVINDHNTGIAQLDNVFIIKSRDAFAARVKATEMMKMVPEAVMKMVAYDLDDLPDVWGYYMPKVKKAHPGDQTAPGTNPHKERRATWTHLE